MVALLVWAGGGYDPVVSQPVGTVAPPAATAPPDRDVFITRFGGVAFGILWPDGELAMPDWQFATYKTVRHIPGSNRNVTQTLGKGPQTVTYRLWIESMADLINLKERVLETDTLVLFADMTSAPDTYRDVHGEGYVYIDDVLLTDLGQPAIFRDGSGQLVIEVDATFQRPSPS